MSGLRIPLNQTYQNKSNTLIHEISSWGYVQVLQYLVRVRTADGTRPAFDLNASNREGPFFCSLSVYHAQISMELGPNLALFWLLCVTGHVKTGRSALHDAVAHYQEGDPFSSDHIKVIQLLLDHGADAGLSVCHFPRRNQRGVSGEIPSSSLSHTHSIYLSFSLLSPSLC